MKYISDERREKLIERLRNQAMRIHMLKTRHSQIISQVGEQMAEVQATCDVALATDSERLLSSASKLARAWFAESSPNEEVERKIERLLTSLEKRCYPSRWIIDYKTSEPPIDGIVSNSAEQRDRN